MPEVEDVCLQLPVLSALDSLQLSALDSLQLSLEDKSDLNGRQPSLSMQELNHKVEWQLGLDTSPTVEGIVPSFNIVVCTDGAHVHTPVDLRPNAAVHRSGSVVAWVVRVSNVVWISVDGKKGRKVFLCMCVYCCHECMYTGDQAPVFYAKVPVSNGTHSQT
jgi:hypothetical protein